VFERVHERRLIEAADSDHNGSVASLLEDELQKLWKLDCVGDVRGLGLLWAVEFVADKKTKDPFPAGRKFAARVSECAAKRGVMLYPMQGCADGKRGDHVMIAPPAVITPEELRWAVEQVGAAMCEASDS
jgi:adenosylmethionine-8-amino-7-oxononanoate aminotransferase